MAKYAARGSTIGRGTVDGGPYTVVAQVKTIGGPELSRGTIDVTDLASTAQEFVGDIIDSGEIALDLIFDPAAATQVTMRQDAESGTLRYFEITWASSPTKYVRFAGIVTKFGVEAAHDGAIMGSATIKVSGALTWQA